jgi:hypothetical protein
MDDAVSKPMINVNDLAARNSVALPNPNKMPTGYICESSASDTRLGIRRTFHGLLTKVIIGPNMRIMSILFSLGSSGSSTGGKPWSILRFALEIRPVSTAVSYRNYERK